MDCLRSVLSALFAHRCKQMADLRNGWHGVLQAAGGSSHPKLALHFLR